MLQGRAAFALSLFFHEPSSLLKPEIALLSLNPAGIAIPYPTDTLAGCPPNVQNAIHRVLVAFVKLNHQGTELAFGLKPDNYRDILFPSFHPVSPRKIADGMHRMVILRIDFPQQRICVYQSPLQAHIAISVPYFIHDRVDALPFLPPLVILIK